jgi:hypothetical protein
MFAKTIDFFSESSIQKLMLSLSNYIKTAFKIGNISSLNLS